MEASLGKTGINCQSPPGEKVARTCFVSSTLLLVPLQKVWSVIGSLLCSQGNFPGVSEARDQSSDPSPVTCQSQDPGEGVTAVRLFPACKWGPWEMARVNLREAPSTAPGTCGLPRKCWRSFQAHLLEDLLQSWVTLAHIQGNLEGGGGGREPIAL